MNKSQVPQVFEVKWPVDDQVIRSGDIIKFIETFYAMSVRRPYRQPPAFEFIKFIVNPRCLPSTSSQPKCLIVCSSHYNVPKPLHHALLRVRAKQVVKDPSFAYIWTPIHDLMDCISVVYQMMFQNMERFVEERLLVLQAARFHGRDHPWQSKFQYLYILEDQTTIAREALNIALRDLEDWNNAEIHGVMLATVPCAEWPIRIERLKKDASHLISCLDGLTEHQDKLRSMLKERVELNSGTRSLIITIFASVYIPLAFVSSYFGMNASAFTDGGLISTDKFWKVSIPLVVGSIIVPVAFSGLLIRKTMQVARSSIATLAGIPYALAAMIVWLIFGPIFKLVLWQINRLADEEDDEHIQRPSSSDKNEEDRDEALEMA